MARKKQKRAYNRKVKTEPSSTVETSTLAAASTHVRQRAKAADEIERHNKVLLEDRHFLLMVLRRMTGGTEPTPFLNADHLDKFRMIVMNDAAHNLNVYNK